MGKLNYKALKFSLASRNRDITTGELDYMTLKILDGAKTERDIIRGKHSHILNTIWWKGVVWGL